MDKPILDDAQYDNFFRNLAEIVHTDLPTSEEKREAVFHLIRANGENGNVDIENLATFISWFADVALEVA